MTVKFYKRKQIRLSNFDYSSSGYYFVTICVKNRVCSLSKIINRKLILNPIGKIIEECWKKIPNRFANVKLDEYIIMPNHFHAIVYIRFNNIVGTRFIVSEKGFDKSNPYIKKNPMTENKISLGRIIRFFKGLSTYKIKCNLNHHFQWQRLYYNHIIRSELSLNEIREYVRNNYLNWDTDVENPKNIKG